MIPLQFIPPRQQQFFLNWKHFFKCKCAAALTMVQEEEEEEELDSPTLDAGHAWKETTQDSFSKNSS
jgi:hypothetical protein